jgi:hypothetical protein
MITINDLLNNITVQGNIRVSAWTRDGEKVIVMTDGHRYDSLFSSELPKRWRNSEILYMFCPDDGFLHIELASED